MTPFFEEIEGLISTKISILKNQFSIFKLEARLAGLSIVPLLFNICMLFIILITMWMGVCAIITYGMRIYFHSLFQSLCYMVLLNGILFILLLMYLKFNLKNMSFEKTRAYLSPKEVSQHDKITKKTAQKHRKAKSARASSTNGNKTT